MASPMENLISAGRTSFGEAEDTFGTRFRGRNVIDSQRYRELDRKQAYFDCTQHDTKGYDFDGRIISSGGGISATQPLLSAEKAPFYVPLRNRRPSAPYRLGRVIVTRFTNLIVGQKRFPSLLCDGDGKTQDYAQALSDAMRLPSKMIRARNLGGAIGSVALSWAYVKGRPVCQVHNTKQMYVHSWDDRDELMPRHVSKVYWYPKDEWDSKTRKYVRNYYWYRRDWTPNCDIAFLPVLVEPNKEPNWEPDLKKSVTHNDKLTHLVWIQNTPEDDIDGGTDIEGVYENLDQLDIMLSVICRGAILNLDPTLKLKVDMLKTERIGLRKGSENAIYVDKDGDAEYLELSGSSIDAGVKLFNMKRGTVLETCECVIPDPDKVAAGAVSKVALELVFAPMTGKGDIFRDQYGQGMKRLIEPMVVVAQTKSTVIIYDEDGNTIEAEPEILLPPKVTKTPKVDEDGQQTGDFDVQVDERDPGEGAEIDVKFGPYFQMTPTDQQTIVTTLSTATAQQPVMSAQTAAEIASEVFGRDAGEEWRRVQSSQQQAQAQQAEMFSDHAGETGGKVTHELEVPGGGKVTKTMGGQPPKPPPPPPGAPGAKGGDPLAGENEGEDGSEESESGEKDKDDKEK